MKPIERRVQALEQATIEEMPSSIELVQVHRDSKGVMVSGEPVAIWRRSTKPG